MLCRRLFSPVLCAVTHGWRTLKTRKHSPYFARITGKLDVEGASPSPAPLLLVGQLHELALGVHATFRVDAAGVGIAGDIRIILFSSFCQVDELGFAVDIELAIDAFGVVSSGV